MKRVKLITETSYETELWEDKKRNNMYIVGLFSSAGMENANKRIYPQNILEREITKFMTEKVNNKTAIGQLNHPTSPETDLEKAAILVESMEWRGKDVYGKAKILNTPSGKTARTLIEDGVKLGISSRGLGTVSEDGHVNEDYQLITYDIVSSPSQPGAWMKGIYEGETFVLPGTDPDLERLEEARDAYFKFIAKFLERMKY